MYLDPTAFWLLVGVAAAGFGWLWWSMRRKQETARDIGSQEFLQRWFRYAVLVFLFGVIPVGFTVAVLLSAFQ